MQFKYRLSFLAATLTILLTASMATAGWGDLAKQAGDAGAEAAGLSYTPSQAIQGVKDVLSLGTGYAETELGGPGGFANNPAVALALPDALKGFGGDSSGLLSSFNKAAQLAVPDTSSIFMSAIENLSVGNPSTLLGGGDDAITRFFETSSRDTLKKLVKPVVETSANTAGVGTYLKAFTAAQQVSGAAFDPYDYITDHTLDGMFHYMAVKEKGIRSGVGGTDLLQKMF